MVKSNIERLFEENPGLPPNYDLPEVKAAMVADGVPEMTVGDVVTGLADAAIFMQQAGLISKEAANALAELSGTFAKRAARDRVNGKRT